MSETRIQGFHVRNDESFERMSEETEAFACEIWRGEEKVGDARNDGRGGPDMLHIRPGEDRETWEALVQSVSQIPYFIGPDGEKTALIEPDGWLLQVLRLARETEAMLTAPGTEARSAYLVHAYEPSDWSDDVVLTPYQLTYAQPDVPPTAVSSDYICLVRIGVDQPGLDRVRTDAPRPRQGRSRG